MTHPSDLSSVSGLPGICKRKASLSNSTVRISRMHTRFFIRLPKLELHSSPEPLL